MKCECDKFLHVTERCPNEADEYEGLLVSPALCVRCLNYCWNEDEDEL